jgi:hypothetical protein
MGRECRLFSRKRVVLRRSRLGVLQKCEALDEAGSVHRFVSSRDSDRRRGRGVRPSSVPLAVHPIAACHVRGSKIGPAEGAGKRATIRPGGPYNGRMTRRVTTVEERIALLEKAPYATSDEVTTLVDGRRLDSREAVEAWLAEVALARQAEALK